MLAVLIVTALLVGGTCGATAPTTTSKRYPVRGVFDRDSSRTGFDHEAAIGFNFIDTGPYAEEIRPLAARGLKGFIWLGGYSNSRCRFYESNRWIRSHVRAIAPRRRGRRPGHRQRHRPRVGGYFIDDEPDATACPSAPAQVRARARLVKSIDPRPPTFIVMNEEKEMKLFAGTVDIIGLNHYPCSIESGCNYSKIDSQAAKADRLGIRYWGVIQAFGDDWFKLPTPDELHQQFVHWRATNMEGYLVFAWHWPSTDSSLWLANHPELQSQLAKENGG